MVYILRKEVGPMYEFDKGVVEDQLRDYYVDPKITTFLNNKGEQIIHLHVDNVDISDSDINLSYVQPNIESAIKEEQILTKLIIDHYSVYYECCNADYDMESMHKNLKYLRMIPVRFVKNAHSIAMDLNFQPVFYRMSYFGRYHFRIDESKADELEAFLKPLRSDILDVVKMNMERGFEFKIMENERFPNVLTTKNGESIAQLLLFPELMERILVSVEGEEFVLKMPNIYNIAFMNIEDYKKDPEKLKNMRGHKTLYSFEKGEGFRLIKE